MTEELEDIKITELENIGFTGQQEKHLTDLFVATVKNMIPTLSRESWFRLDDFFDAETHGVADLRMLIIRKTIHCHDQWHGIIQGYRKRLKLVAIVEDMLMLKST